MRAFLSILHAFLILNLISCAEKEPRLKDYFEDDFYIGAAVNLGQVNGKEVGADSLLSLHFSSITSENGLKWGPVHPKEGTYSAYYQILGNFIKG